VYFCQNTITILQEAVDRLEWTNGKRTGCYRSLISHPFISQSLQSHAAFFTTLDLILNMIYATAIAKMATIKMFCTIVSFLCVDNYKYDNYKYIKTSMSFQLLSLTCIFLLYI